MYPNEQRDASKKCVFQWNYCTIHPRDWWRWLEGIEEGYDWLECYVNILMNNIKCKEINFDDLIYYLKHVLVRLCEIHGVFFLFLWFEGF